jgi:hypothetical protein
MQFQKEKRRNRILQSFVAGLIKSVSDHVSQTDVIDISSADDILKIHNKKFPVPYNEILNSITMEFQKDFWLNPYRKWINKDRKLFYDGKYANDGFNMIYWDFFDKAVLTVNGNKEKEKRETPNHKRRI